jgi:hypothetical protein
MDEGTKALFERLSNVDADDYADANLGTTVNELITNLGEVTDQGFSLGPKVTAESVNDLLPSASVADLTSFISQASTYTDADIEKIFTDAGYNPSEEEISRFTGEYQNQLEDITQYVDENSATLAEIEAIAAEEGITDLTEAGFNFDAVLQGSEDQILNGLRAEFDQAYTTEQEARDFFDSLGFTPTDEQVAGYIGNTDDNANAEIAAFVDANQVTEAEALAKFAEYGYTPTAEELAGYIGQVPQGSTFANIESYADPRVVTEEEARQLFADSGYTPTDEQVQEFIGQVSETEQAENISNYVDPRQVTVDEIAAIAEQEGLTFEEAMAQTYIGQGDSADFQTQQETAARAEFDPLITTLDEAQEFFANTGYDATAEELAQFVASKPETEQQSAINATGVLGCGDFKPNTS